MNPTSTAHDNAHLSDLPKSMLKYPYHYCHRAIYMVHFNHRELPYGNERDIHDGRRVRTTLKDTWMEPLHAKATGKGVFVRPEVAQEGGLHLPSFQVVRSYGRRGFEEARSSNTVASSFSVATQPTAYRLDPVQQPTAIRCHFMPIISETLPYDNSYSGLWVAGEVYPHVL